MAEFIDAVYTQDIQQDDDIQEHQADLLKCVRSEAQAVEYVTFDDLFDGFDTCRIITFSYNLSLLEKIASKVKYLEVIVAPDWSVTRNKGLNQVVLDAVQMTSMVLAHADSVTKQVRSHKTLVQMIHDGDVVIRVPRVMKEHRKMYLLESQDGRTRVIYGSANMTPRAWNGDQIENYFYDESRLLFDEFKHDFDCAWDLCEELPISILISPKPDDPTEDSVLIPKAREVDKLVIAHPAENEKEVAEFTQYVFTVNENDEKYQDLLKGTRLREKDGMISLMPKTVARIDMNIKRNLQKKKDVQMVIDKYPSISFGDDLNKYIVSGTEIPLVAERKEVQKEAKELLEIFGNFAKDFTGEPYAIQHQQENHFKLMTYMFISPFIAKLRCRAYLSGIETSSMPLFLLEASERANSGKTFMTNLFMKMMTGKNNIMVYAAKDIDEKYIQGMRSEITGMPVLIDEIDGKYFANRKSMIKTADTCEKSQLEGHPLIIFATNCMVDPGKDMRKRMLFLRYDSVLKSVDQSAYDAQGKRLIQNMGNAFYREYVSRILPKINTLMDYMLPDQKRPNNWYPDIVKLSSETILEVFQYAGLKNMPHYMHTLTWRDDFGPDSGNADALSRLTKMWYDNRSMFEIKSDIVTLHVGTDAHNKKMFDSWANTLPVEVNPVVIPTQKEIRLTMQRRPLEELTGISFGIIGRFMPQRKK